MLHFFKVVGAIEPEVHHPAVPKDDVVMLKSFMDEGKTFKDALLLLRRRALSHFPMSHDPCPRKKGISFIS